MRTSPVLEAALRYATTLGIFPVTVGGRFDKRPAFEVKDVFTQYRSSLPTEIDVRKWWGGRKTLGIALHCGSWGLTCIDFDDPSTFEPWRELVRENGGDDLLRSLAFVKTRHGYHAWVRCPNYKKPGAKIASFAQPKWSEERGKDVEERIETRGLGQYAILPPSPGYEPISGDILRLPAISLDDMELLLAAVSMFDERLPEPEVKRPRVNSTGYPEGERPGDWFNRTADWRDLIEKAGGRLLYDRGGRMHFERPGKNRGQTSVTTGNGLAGQDLAKMHTSNWPPFEMGEAYSKFHWYAIAEHGGSDSEAAAAIVRMPEFQREARGTRPQPKPEPKTKAPVIEPIEPGESGPYFEMDGKLWQNVVNRDGVPTPKMLANFTARISEEVHLDDGEDSVRIFRVAADVFGHRRSVDVPARDFNSMNWIGEKLGASAFLSAGQSVRDNARAAIQALSIPVPERTVYSHTGWRKIEGEPVYLTGAGAIGAGGPLPWIDVDLDRNLSHYRIEEPTADPVECLRASLALLDLAPLRVTAALFGSVFLAPLTSLFDADAPDFVTWFFGASGTFKSELAALAQSHFGNFGRSDLPGSFTSTANSIERLWFTTKDALLVMDDFFPTDNPKEAQAMQAVADRLLRGVGNRKGRDRMRADTRNRSGLPPRGMVLATSERLMSLQSTSARMFAVEVKKGDVDVPKLTQSQENRRLLQGATYQYVRWIAQDEGRVREMVGKTFRATRSQLSQDAEHRRQPSQVAHLVTGIAMALRCFEELGAIDKRGVGEIGRSSLQALQENAHEHGDVLEAQRPVNRFMILLREAISSGRAHVLARDRSVPTNPGDWGWKRRAGDTYAWDPANAQGMIGVVDETHLDLLPEQTFALVKGEAKRQGGDFPVDQTTLVKLLHDAGVLAGQKDGDKTRRLTQARLGGALVRVMRIPLQKYWEVGI